MTRVLGVLVAVLVLLGFSIAFDAVLTREAPAQERQLVRPDIEEEKPLLRIIDSAYAINCYHFRPTGAFTCVPWGQRD